MPRASFKSIDLSSIEARREALQAELAALDEQAKAAELAARDAGRPVLLAALDASRSRRWRRRTQRPSRWRLDFMAARLLRSIWRHSRAPDENPHTSSTLSIHSTGRIVSSPAYRSCASLIQSAVRPEPRAGASQPPPFRVFGRPFMGALGYGDHHDSGYFQVHRWHQKPPPDRCQTDRNRSAPRLRFEAWDRCTDPIDQSDVMAG